MVGIFTCTSQVATHPMLAYAHTRHEFKQMHLPKNYGGHLAIWSTYLEFYLKSNTSLCPNILLFFKIQNSLMIFFF